MIRAKLFSAILSFSLVGTAAAELELISPQAVQRPDSGSVDNSDIAPLRSAIDWISHVFRLPKMQNSPKMQRLSAETYAFATSESFTSGRPLDTAVMNYHRTGHEIVAYYDDATFTIYLPDSWNGSTPAEMSILIHAMIYHFQNLGGRKYYCPEERKALPYEAQERWLGLYGRSLKEDFNIEPGMLMLLTECMP